MTWTSQAVDFNEIASYLDTMAPTGNETVIIVKWNLNSVLITVGTP